MKADFVYTGIRVKDINQSVEFYTKLLGMKIIRRAKIPETGGEFVLLQSKEKGSLLELNFYPQQSKYYSEYKNGEELDHLAFSVKNLDKALAFLHENGIRQELEIKTSKNRWVYVKDPNGIWIELFEQS